MCSFFHAIPAPRAKTPSFTELPYLACISARGGWGGVLYLWSDIHIKYSRRMRWYLKKKYTGRYVPGIIYHMYSILKASNMFPRRPVLTREELTDRVLPLSSEDLLSTPLQFAKIAKQLTASSARPCACMRSRLCVRACVSVIYFLWCAGLAYWAACRR